jgi:hypothetical protein
MIDMMFSFCSVFRVASLGLESRDTCPGQPRFRSRPSLYKGVMMTRQEEFVRRFREQTPEIDDEIDVFAAWLKENGLARPHCPSRPRSHGLRIGQSTRRSVVGIGV